MGRAIARLLQWNHTVGGVVLLWITTACSAVTANIPLAAMLAKIVSSGGFAADNVALWWTVIFGANLGGNITPIGSASTLIATSLLRKAGADVGFLGFVRLAVVFAGAQLVVASTYVTLYMRFGNAFTLWGNAALYLVLAVVAARAVSMRRRRRE